MEETYEDDPYKENVVIPFWEGQREQEFEKLESISN